MENNPIKISVCFKEYETMIFLGVMVYNMETAIKIVRLLKLKNVQLTQEKNGNVMEWDNF